MASQEIAVIVKLFTRRLPFFSLAFPNIFGSPGSSSHPQRLPCEMKLGLYNGDRPRSGCLPGLCIYMNELEGASRPIFSLIQVFLLLSPFLLPTTSSSCFYSFLYSGISLPALISQLQSPLLALGPWKSKNARTSCL